MNSIIKIEKDFVCVNKNKKKELEVKLKENKIIKFDYKVITNQKLFIRHMKIDKNRKLKIDEIIKKEIECIFGDINNVVFDYETINKGGEVYLVIYSLFNKNIYNKYRNNKKISTLAIEIFNSVNKYIKEKNYLIKLENENSIKYILILENILISEFTFNSEEVNELIKECNKFSENINCENINKIYNIKIDNIEELLLICNSKNKNKIIERMEITNIENDRTKREKE